MASSTNEWSPPPRVLHQGPRQEAASMTVCSNAVENLHIGALAREQRTSTPNGQDAPCGRHCKTYQQQNWRIAARFGKDDAKHLSMTDR